MRILLEAQNSVKLFFRGSFDPPFSLSVHGSEQGAFFDRVVVNQVAPEQSVITINAPEICVCRDIHPYSTAGVHHKPPASNAIFYLIFWKREILRNENPTLPDISQKSHILFTREVNLIPAGLRLLGCVHRPVRVAFIHPHGIGEALTPAAISDVMRTI